MLTKIFLTVGTQLPFNRLVRALDDWAARSPEADVTAQIGNGLQPQDIDWKRFMPATEFRANFEAADVIVAHAGMGTILTGLDLGKPLIIMPRIAGLAEHRNDHQVATARQFDRFSQVHTVNDSLELTAALERIDVSDIAAQGSACASTELLTCIRRFTIGEVSL